MGTADNTATLLSKPIFGPKRQKLMTRAFCDIYIMVKMDKYDPFADSATDDR